MKCSIKLDHFSVSYSENDFILKDLCIDIYKGEFILISGLSGNGKTTLLSSINGVIPNSVNASLTGDIYVNGNLISGKSIRDISTEVGTVMQNPDNQIFHSLVEDEITFGLENLNYSKSKMNDKLKNSLCLFKLNPKDYTKTLSGGQKQKLIMASIFAMDQKILLIDEPLANLDIQSSMMILGILKDLCKEGYTVLMVEHRLDIVLPFVNRVLEIKNRKINEIDKKEALSSYKNTIIDTANLQTNEKVVLSTKELCYKVKEKTILENINLDIYQGERIVVLGDNGTGKTTLLKLLGGLIKPSDGYFSTSLDVKIGSKKWFKKVGYVYQDPSYQLFMPSVEDEFLISPYKDWAMECLEKFNFKDIKHSHPHSLSEGQKRRLSIAAVIASKPEIVLLDEPSVGQDYQNMKLLVENLNRIHTETGNTMITITHDVRCAEALCDRAIVIGDKGVLKQGGKKIIREFFKQ